MPIIIYNQVAGSVLRIRLPRLQRVNVAGASSPPPPFIFSVLSFLNSLGRPVSLPIGMGTGIGGCREPGESDEEQETR